MRDDIFMFIKETLEEKEDLRKIDFSTCTFERIHFHDMEAAPSRFEKTHHNIVNANPEVF